MQSDFLNQTLFFAAPGVPPGSLLIPASQHPLPIWDRTCCYGNWLWMLRMLPGLILILPFPLLPLVLLPGIRLGSTQEVEHCGGLNTAVRCSTRVDLSRSSGNNPRAAFLRHLLQNQPSLAVFHSSEDVVGCCGWDWIAPRWELSLVPAPPAPSNVVSWNQASPQPGHALLCVGFPCLSPVGIGASCLKRC